MCEANKARSKTSEPEVEREGGLTLQEKYTRAMAQIKQLRKQLAKSQRELATADQEKARLRQELAESLERKELASA